MDTVFAILLGLAMFITLGVVMVGIVSFGVNGEFYRKNSNKLMQMRVVFQGLAILFFAFLTFAILR